MKGILKVIATSFFLMSSDYHQTMASSTTSAATLAFAAAAATTNNDSYNDDIPRLPVADPDSQLPTIQLGETISFQEMGPVIINTDGTTRRISNWDTLSDLEKEVSWRRIAKRNGERRAKWMEMEQTQVDTNSNDNFESK
jgi:hypothetical protein